MNNNETNHTDINARIIRFGSVLVAIAIILTCFAMAKVNNLFFKIALNIVAAVVGCFGLFLIITVIVGSRMSKVNSNFFLYDKKKKANIPVGELTVEEVRSRLFSLISVFRYKGKLYIGDLFSDERSIPDVFKTLFCYELLCELSEDSAPEVEKFLSFGDECGDIFFKYLSLNSDYELAEDIRGYIRAYSDGKADVEEFHKYIIAKKQSFETKMLDYTVENIDSFN